MFRLLGCDIPKCGSPSRFMQSPAGDVAVRAFEQAACIRLNHGYFSPLGGGHCKGSLASLMPYAAHIAMHGRAPGH